jgi:cold shock CspA family protein
MQLPLQITFRGVPPSETLVARIRTKAQELERFYGRLVSCRVIVEALHRRHRKGRLYHVRVDVGVPGGELVVSRDPAMAHEHQDPYVAVRDAFDATARQVEDYVRLRRGHTKRHAELENGRVARLFPRAGYGFLESADGVEVYFHRNAVVGGAFQRLTVGSEVRYRLADGEKGPRAIHVQPLGKHLETRESLLS